MCYCPPKELWDSVIEMYKDLGNKTHFYKPSLQVREIQKGANRQRDKILPHFKEDTARP